MLKKLTCLVCLGALLTACQSGPGDASAEAASPPSTGAVEVNDTTEITDLEEGIAEEPAANDYAGVPGSDVPLEKMVRPGHRRYVYPDYRVEVRDRNNGPGERLTVYRKEGDKETLLLNQNEASVYFAGIHGSFLLLDEGTGNGLRTLTILDLEGKGQPRVRFRSAYHSEKLAIEDGKLVFYGLLPDDSMVCRIDEQTTGRQFDTFQVDLVTLEAQPTGAKKCLALE